MIFHVVRMVGNPSISIFYIPIKIRYGRIAGDTFSFGLSDCSWEHSWMVPKFIPLNVGWNADPNVPHVETRVTGHDLLLLFNVNGLQFSEFRHAEPGILSFVNCSQFRLGAPNDEGWYAGQCRFSGLAPVWGEFYAVIGDPGSITGPDDWVILKQKSGAGSVHFLFYFRDETFECVSEDCGIEPIEENALFRAGRSIPSIYFK